MDSTRLQPWSILTFVLPLTKLPHLRDAHVDVTDDIGALEIGIHELGLAVYFALLALVGEWIRRIRQAYCRCVLFLLIKHHYL